MVKRTVSADELRAALKIAAHPSGATTAEIASAVRATARALAQQHPGRSVEIRIPPYVAVQAIAGIRHTRGTPPNVIETNAATWFALVTGRQTFTAALADNHLTASGTRADLSSYLPLRQAVE